MKTPAASFACVRSAGWMTSHATVMCRHAGHDYRWPTKNRFLLLSIRPWSLSRTPMPGRECSRQSVRGPWRFFQGAFVAIEHFGSTAIPQMSAKPIVDILAGVESLSGAGALAAQLCEAGYSHQHRRIRETTAPRRSTATVKTHCPTQRPAQPERLRCRRSGCSRLAAGLCSSLTASKLESLSMPICPSARESCDDVPPRIDGLCVAEPANRSATT